MRRGYEDESPMDNEGMNDKASKLKEWNQDGQDI